MPTDYNKDAWRLVEKKVMEKIAAAVTAALDDGGAIANAIAAAVTAHEAKAEGDTFANSHVVASAE